MEPADETSQTSDRNVTRDPDPQLTTVIAAQVNLFCEDVERCAQFFEAPGMPRAFTSPGTGAREKIEVDAGGFRIGFDSVEAANRIADLGATAGGPRSTDVALWVHDADGLYERALQMGGTSLRAPMNGPAGLRYAWILDPEGHQIRLLQELAD